MKEKFWKELKSRLCPRETWVRDCDSAKCQCCGKEFTFIRRRHHCRFCGKLFCSHCSDLYINGTYLGLSEKYVRHCEFCKEEIEKIKKDLNRLIYMVQEEEDFARPDDDDDSNSSSEEDDEYFSVRVIFGSEERDSEYKFMEELDLEIKTICKRMLGKLIDLGSISHEYSNSRLLEILSRAVVECKMNILPHDFNSRSSYMDISKHVSIKTLSGQAGEHLELIRGMILEKSLPMKHMLNRLIKPQVILIENSLDESGVKVRFEDLIINDHVIFEQLEEKIMKFNPDIVFVERTVNREILDFFSEKGITVISGLKKKDIAKIVQITGIRSTIKNVWTIDKYKPSHLVGTVDLMHTKKFDRNEEPIIYFEKNIGMYSILVSERTHEQEVSLKKSLQVLMKFMRQIHLEKYLIYVDFEMWEEKESRNVPRLFSINPNHVANLEKFRSESIEFYRLRLSEVKLEKEDKKLKYCRTKGRSNYLQNCGEGVHEVISPYSEEDSTIGHFLLIMATNLVKKCSECKWHHRQRYYFADYGIEVSISSLKEQQKGREEIRDEEDLNIEKLHKYLKKYKENWDIFSYFQCKYCQNRLTKRVKIGKNYLKNSFYYFLYLVANSEGRPLDQSKRTQKIISSNLSLNSNKECGHLIVERVLQTSDIVFRMQSFKIQHYNISVINLRDEQYISIYRLSLRKYIIDLVNTEIEQKFSFQEMLLNIVNSYICILEPFRFQEQVESKIIIELEKLENIRDILEKLHVYIEQLWIKQRGKEISYTSDWTFFVRETAKIDYIIKTSVDILKVIETNLHKRKKKIEENEVMSVYSNEDLQSLLPENEKMEELYPLISKDEIEEFQLRRNSSRENGEIEAPELLERELSKDKISEDSQKRGGEQKFSIKSLSKKISTSILTFNLVYNEPRLRSYVEEIKKRRYQLKKGQYLYFNLVNYKKALNVLVCALNSIDFKEMFQKRNCPDVFKFNLILSKDIPTSWDLKQKIDKVKGEMIEDDNDPRESFDVIAYYHREFHNLREMEGIPMENYIKSLANSSFWETVGGKSNSEFAKSSDEILVIKNIKHDEFQQFLKFASDYLKHVQSLSRGKGSYLAKIYGIYDIIIRGDSYKCVVMQNLFLGFEGLSLKKYDLKGSQVNRLFLSKTNGQNVTGLDTNFKIDKNYHPYFIKYQSYRKFFDALEEDVRFLEKNKVIDYSLLVIEHENKLRMGIIDYMRPYHLMEKIQNKYKEITNKMQPTVIPPKEYVSRFLLAIQKYFTFYH